MNGKSRRHCLNCGKEERCQTIDSLFCKKCGALMDPNDPNNPLYSNQPAPATAGAIDDSDSEELIFFDEENEKKENKTMKVLRIIGYILGLVIAIAIATILIWAGILFIMDKNHGSNDASLDGAAADVTAVETTTDATAAAKFNSSDYQVGEPANADDINPDVWNQPYSDAVMVGIDGTTSVYTQSGKDGSTTLSGTIPTDWVLIVDSLDLNVNGESFIDGNLLVIINDSKTDKDISGYGISYFNGGSQLTPISNLQNLLDSNIAVKFARGDWNKEIKQWSYSPWALANIWLPDGYTYNPLKLDYASDTYPNKDNATDTSVNTSGAN